VRLVALSEGVEVSALGAEVGGPVLSTLFNERRNVSKVTIIEARTWDVRSCGVGNPPREKLAAHCSS